MVEFKHGLLKYDSPFIEFPERPEIMSLEGYDVYKYIEPSEMANLVKRFSEKINLNWFDAIAVNQIGGEYFAQELARLQSYSKPIFDIEYHRDHRIVKAVPQELRGLKIGVIDDIRDSGGTGQDILEDAPLASFLFLTEKVDVPNQINFPRSASVVKINNVWVGGCKMNLDAPGDGLPENFGRDYPGIIVKIQN